MTLAYQIPGERAPDSHLGRYLVIGTAALAAAALIVAAVFGIQWWVLSGNDNLELAQARDRVSQTAVTAVHAYVDIDYTTLDAYFQRAIGVSDSDLGNQLRTSETNYRKGITDAQTKVTDSTVLDVGVEELNMHDGKASVLAAVRYVVSVKGQQPATKLQRMELQMSKVGPDWKVSGIGSVPMVGGQ